MEVHIAKTVQKGIGRPIGRRAGSWLGRSPFQKNDIETVEKWMQVRPGDQPGYPKDTIESFVGHSSMGLLCPPAEIENEIR